MGVYWAWFSTLVSYTSSWPELAAYVIISHGFSGILHVQITLSHFCMETFTKEQPVYTSDDNDWFKVQLATTMDVDCPQWMDWFHGGLQFQIEHHLFPRLPRHNLRECQIGEGTLSEILSGIQRTSFHRGQQESIPLPEDVSNGRTQAHPG